MNPGPASPAGACESPGSAFSKFMFMISVRVRYYAQLREALKTGSEEISIAAPVDERGLLEHLAGLHPRQRDLFLASRIAVADAYAEAGRAWEGPELDSGVDIISPISGG